jgi:hypothetical protein
MKYNLLFILISLILIIVLHTIKSNLFKVEPFEADCITYPFLCLKEYPEIIKQYSNFNLVKTNNILETNKKVK